LTACRLKPGRHFLKKAANMGIRIDEAERLANRGTKRRGTTRRGEPCTVASDQWKKVTYTNPRECTYFGITIDYV